MRGLENRVMSNLGMTGFQSLKRKASAEDENARNRVITEMFLNRITTENRKEAEQVQIEQLKADAKAFAKNKT